MKAYGRFGTKLAMYVEIAKSLGISPYWRIQNIHGELIVEIPYCTVILTPEARLRDEYTLKRPKKWSRAKPNEKRNRRLSTTSARITKN